MENNSQNRSSQKCFVVAVALKKGRYKYYVSEPEIFYNTISEAQKIKDELIENGRFAAEQLKVQTVWKVKL